MKTIDFSAMIITYNFVVGFLLIVAGEKLGAYAGLLAKRCAPQIRRLARLTAFTMGACFCIVSGAAFVGAGY